MYYNGNIKIKDIKTGIAKNGQIFTAITYIVNDDKHPLLTKGTECTATYWTEVNISTKTKETIKVVQPERLSEEDTKKERNIIDRYFETD